MAITLLLIGKANANETPTAVPAAGPGVFSQRNHGGSRMSLSVKGHTLSSRAAIEKYLAYRAAESTMEGKGRWFTLEESRTKADTVPVPQRDPAAVRYSFRMKYWRPLWRYKLAGNSAWKTWSPFSGTAFFADGKDPQTITDFEVTADVTSHTGPMSSDDPLAFDAGAVYDFLVNQVSPPT